MLALIPPTDLCPFRFNKFALNDSSKNFAHSLMSIRGKSNKIFIETTWLFCIFNEISCPKHESYAIFVSPTSKFSNLSGMIVGQTI